MTRLSGKVAFVTGAGLGQGRSHAVRLAEEGADIIAVDICHPIDTAVHPFATEDDLQETARLVEKFDRRIVTARADVRDLAALCAVVDDGVAQLGRLDIVAANAAIASFGQLVDLDEQTWKDMIDVNLTGVWNTLKASVPQIIAGGRGGSIILTSSAAGAAGVQNLGHYVAAKHGVLGLMKTLALEMGPQFIRCNAILPTNVDTTMIQNDFVRKIFMPHLENPTREDAEQPGSSYREFNALPIPWVDPVDISNALVFLASDEARYITGVSLPVDAGLLLK